MDVNHMTVWGRVINEANPDEGKACGASMLELLLWIHPRGHYLKHLLEPG